MVIFQAQTLATSNSTTCACQTLFTFHVKYQNTRMVLISKKVIKSILEASSGAIETPRFGRLFFKSKFEFLYQSYLSLSSFVMYFQLTPVFNNSWCIYSSFSCLFLHLGLISPCTIFIDSISRSKRMKTAT